MIHSKGDKYILELTSEELAFVYCLVAKSQPEYFITDTASILYKKCLTKLKEKFITQIQMRIALTNL